MKKPQWIIIAVAVILTISIFVFARRIPDRKVVAETHNENDGHDHGSAERGTFSIDSIISIIKEELSPQQVAALSEMEKPLESGMAAVGGQVLRDQQLSAYHSLEHYWRDSIDYFPAAIWYKAEAARLENSEKSLTFAAHLILSNLQEGRDPDPAMIKWKGLQARDLFERSLKINPDNDSSRLGLAGCYMFGNISDDPMKDGLGKIMQEVEKDSTNVFAQMMLVKGGLMTQQYDKAIARLHTVCRVQPGNLQALLLLADLYERKNDKMTAIEWYRKSLSYIKRPDARTMIEQRIVELSK